ncbi:hypothetical protein [uncultured Azohydromonas sp.]|jgi:hypothetical protein|uniref:hypothetical protein n=1 Tax=uncultured Azohydromonas sp. TaxID=487342 RepID=UPI0026363BD3|nr:hypothetical protein [uncultured Azohydromonas sp.]
MPQLSGTANNQTPTNGDLGGMAHQSPEGFVLRPQSSATPYNPGDMVFQSTEAALTVKRRMADGSVKSISWPWS